MMEESDESGDVFQCQVGNLPPNTDAAIRFAYVIELDIQADKSVKFVIPAILGQRYGGATKPLPSTAADGRPFCTNISMMYKKSDENCIDRHFFHNKKK